MLRSGFDDRSSYYHVLSSVICFLPQLMYVCLDPASRYVPCKSFPGITSRFTPIGAYPCGHGYTALADMNLVVLVLQDSRH
ncbi:hypothetical protein SCLCIDRAFT_859796 [Scleroderma citrinum Foug A]|uniref:Uncharacterized protein n=1 Tax=Scleroderma citrinum Foug A TaxID=1036808 RepID=A0A0C3AAD3_9AGAM|nr:hypothetical protein SCLCIDRAFT_859796 [Scleroderma citrinum Foug A]